MLPAQPRELHYLRGRRAIPEGITLGRAADNGKIVGIPIRDKSIYNHIMLRGLSGVGKSRLMSILLQNLLASGHRVIMIDPLGEVYHLMQHWVSHLCLKTYLKSPRLWEHMRQKVLSNILFIDLSKPDHNWRHNMLSPQGPDGNLSRVIARIVKFFNCLFSTEAGKDAMDSQLQRRTNMINLAILFSVTGTPMMDALQFIYDRQFREKILKQAEQRSKLFEVHRQAIPHYRFLLDEFKGSKFAEKINSLETGLSVFYENPACRNFLMTSENNIDFHDILNNKSVFVKIPACDLATRRLLLQYFYCTLLGLAEHRPRNASPVFLASDESALVFNSTLSDYSTRIRNHNVYLIHSHQSIGQLLTPEMIKIAENIESMCQIKIFFRHGYKETGEVVDGLLKLQGTRPKNIEVTYTLSKSTAEATSTGISETTSHNSSKSAGYSVNDSTSQTHSTSQSISDTFGMTASMQKGWSEALNIGESHSWNINNSFTYTETAGETWQRMESEQFTCTLADGRLMTRINTESGAVTISETDTESETTSESSGTSEGTSEGISHVQGTGTSRSVNYQSLNGGNTVIIQQGTPISLGSPATLSEAETVSKFLNASNSRSEQKSKVVSTMYGIAKGIAKSRSEARSRGHASGTALGISENEAIAMGRAFSKAASIAQSYARAIQESLGHSSGISRSTTHTHSASESQALTRSRAYQQGESFANAVARQLGVNISSSIGMGLAHGIQKSFTLTNGMSLSISWKIICCTLAEERTLFCQEIRSLPRKTFYLSIDQQPALLVISGECYELPVKYGKHNFFFILTQHYDQYPLLANKTLQLPDELNSKEPAKTELAGAYPLLKDFSHFFTIDEE